MKYRIRIYSEVFLQIDKKVNFIDAGRYLSLIIGSALSGYHIKAPYSENKLVPIYIIKRGSESHHQAKIHRLQFTLSDEQDLLLYDLIIAQVKARENLEPPELFNKLKELPMNEIKENYYSSYWAMKKYMKVFHAMKRRVILSIILDDLEIKTFDV